VLTMVVLDLQAIAGRRGDAWQSSAAAAAARMRGPDGFFTIQLDAGDAATVQVGQQGCLLVLVALAPMEAAQHCTMPQSSATFCV